MRKYIIIGLIFLSDIAFGQSKYQKDFNEFWTDIHENYAYFQQQGIDWMKVKEIYEPQAKAINNNDDFIRFLETVLNELHNGHCSLNMNLKTSNRLIPTGLDIYVESINNQFIITDLRKDFGSEKSGLKTGMEIVKFNDKSIEEQLKSFLPKYTTNPNASMYQYAISMLFAGTHDTKRKITALDNGVEKDYFPDSIVLSENNKLLEFKIVEGNVGYIKINNSLGDNNLILEFDKALDNLMTTKSLIIDLSETPSGGNTTVARAIMGRFIEKKMPYQQHEYDELDYNTKRSWVEYVTPRSKMYKGKLVVMVGHWTGSMGEGMAVGFDGMKRAKIIGTKMAGLIGAISGFSLSETKIGFQFPTERLYHINGTPREDYLPNVLTQNTYDTWEKAKKILNVK